MDEQPQVFGDYVTSDWYINMREDMRKRKLQELRDADVRNWQRNREREDRLTVSDVPGKADEVVGWAFIVLMTLVVGLAAAGVSVDIPNVLDYLPS